MTKASTISVIVPVYNTGDYLRQCLDSLLNQSFHAWECICIDDGSSDSSVQIQEEYAKRDPRFIIRQKEHGGVTSARKMGVSLANTPFLCFMDSDDRMPPDALERLMDHQQKSGAKIVRGNFSFDEKNHLRENRLSGHVPFSKKEKNSEYSYHITSGDHFFPYCLRTCSLWGTLFDSSIFKMANHFPDDKVILGEDGLTLFSILLQTDKMIYVDEIVYWYRVNEHGCSGKLYSDPEKELQADIDFTAELVKLIARFPEKKCSWLKYYAADNIYGKFLRTEYFQNNREHLKYLYKSYYCKDLSVQSIVWKINWKKWGRMWLAWWKMF